MSYNLNFIMQNTIRFKVGKRDQGNKHIVEFLSLLRREVDGFSGYLVINSIADEQVSSVFTFWETKQQMNTFYKNKNAILDDFAQRLMPLIEKRESIHVYQTEIADFTNIKQPIMLA